MMKASFTLLFILLIGVCFAQHTPAEPLRQNSISLHIGKDQFKDENLHPKVFSGLNAGAIYSHSRTRNNISEYSAGLDISFLNTVYEEFPSALSILILGNYNYLFPVVNTEKFIYHIGPLAQLQFGTNAYFNWDESHFYSANYISGGVSNRINYNSGKYNFEFNLEMPLISIISRPKPNRQYKIDDMTFMGVIKNLSSNPEFVLPDKNFYVQTGLELKFGTKKNKMRSVGYNFRYHFMQAKNGEPYQNAKHSISYKFIMQS